MTNEHKEPWTPGPWRVHPKYGNQIIRDAERKDDRKQVCMVATRVREYEYDPAETTPDARLIAEAPAMAALLERLVAIVESPRSLLVDVVALDAKKLLSRARGEGRT